MKDDNYQGETFLNRLYKDLHISDEVMHMANSSDTKDEKVRKYLERLEKVERLAKNSKHNGIDLLKEMYYKKYVIKPENVPESYFEMQKNIALERGFGNVQISHDARVQMINAIINDQKKSLDIWLDYFLSEDALYPEWFKYYAFQGMIKLGSYDKEKESFNKRTVSTTNIFVDLNREALALVYDNLCDALSGQKVEDELLQKLLDGGSFTKLYAYMIHKLDSAKKDLGSSKDGIWIKYDQGSDPTNLVKSLEGKGTGWCTAGIETARIQLQNGDFYVYYTADSNGEYKQPRVAIRMEGNSIGEVRGISEHQNLESEMEEILEKKLDEFPDRDKYKKKVKDMEKLTTIYKEHETRELSLEELRFLYEIDEDIKGFGYDDDPRIKKILHGRNFKKDLAKVFNCSEDEISEDANDVLNGKKIVCYYGSLDLRSFTNAKDLTLPNYIYGYLDLRGLTSAEGLILPNSIGGSLCLNRLKSAEGLILPNNIGYDLNLDSLESAEGLTFPTSVGRDLNLYSLESAEGLTLPSSVGRDLNLDSLESVEGLILPNNIGGDLLLSGLTSIDNFTFSSSVRGSLYLRGLANAKGLILPNNVGRDLFLDRLISAEDLILPSSVGRNLFLGSLTSAKGLILPNSVGNRLEMYNLMSLDGLIIPNGFKFDGLLDAHFTVEDLIDKSLENNEISKQKGFSKINMLIIINILIIISIIFFGCLFMV